MVCLDGVCTYVQCTMEKRVGGITRQLSSSNTLGTLYSGCGPAAPKMPYDYDPLRASGPLFYSLPPDAITGTSLLEPDKLDGGPSHEAL